MSILLQKTIELLKETKIPADKLAAECGVHHRTIRVMRNGCPNIPNVELCEKLYTILSGKQLEL